MYRLTIRALGAIAVSLLSIQSASAQQPVGTIVGQVLQGEGRTPLVGAQVQIVGTNLGALSVAEGRFVIRNVPVGTRVVRVQSMGFGSADQTVTVTAGATANVTFQLREQAVAIAPVVVTALGISRNEKSLGYAVQSLSTAQLERIPETNPLQALAGQSAGVQVVQSSGRPGAGTRVT